MPYVPREELRDKRKPLEHARAWRYAASDAIQDPVKAARVSDKMAVRIGGHTAWAAGKLGAGTLRLFKTWVLRMEPAERKTPPDFVRKPPVPGWINPQPSKTKLREFGEKVRLATEHNPRGVVVQDPPSQLGRRALNTPNLARNEGETDKRSIPNILWNNQGRQLLGKVGMTTSNIMFNTAYTVTGFAVQIIDDGIIGGTRFYLKDLLWDNTFGRIFDPDNERYDIRSSDMIEYDNHRELNEAKSLDDVVSRIEKWANTPERQAAVGQATLDDYRDRFIKVAIKGDNLTPAQMQEFLRDLNTTGDWHEVPESVVGRHDVDRNSLREQIVRTARNLREQPPERSQTRDDVLGGSRRNRNPDDENDRGL